MPGIGRIDEGDERAGINENAAHAASPSTIPATASPVVRAGSRTPRRQPVEIGSDVWVGGGAIILPGVRIGSRAVIGAGSVVTGDMPENVFAAGTPCRVIRDIVE